MIHFRPLPALSLAALPALILLLVLGGWQVQRMQWKSGLIAAYEARGEASSLAEAWCAMKDGDEFSPSFIAPAPIAFETVRLYALREGRAGWVRLIAAETPACRDGRREGAVLFEAAFEDFRTGALTTTSTWRLEAAPSATLFTPSNDASANEWYSVDLEAMAEALGVEAPGLAPVWARSDAGLPGSLARTPPSTHAGYALTWFGLAGALLAVYIGLHVARRRLYFGARRP